MNLALKNTVLFITICICLSGCLQDKLVKGVRVNIDEEGIKNVDSLEVKVPTAVNLTSWGGPTIKSDFESQNYFLKETIEPSWTIKTGLGRLISSPVILNHKVFVLGANGHVKCIDLATRKTIWDFRTHGDNIGKLIIGGGLAFDATGNLYVTTSLGELLSIAIDSGTLNWRVRSDSPIMDDPTVLGDNIYFTEASGVSRAFSSTGKLNWSFSGLAGKHIRSKIGKPVTFGDSLLLPSGGGVLTAVAIDDGSKIWSFDFTNQRLGYAQNTFGSFNGQPEVFSDRIYFGSVNGQFNLLNKSGESVWQAKVGLQGSPISIDNSVFFISDRNKLVRLEKDSGKIIWAKTITNTAAFEHYFSPILAGSKLWITGTNNFLRSFNVNSGNLNNKLSIKSESSGPPIYYQGSIIVYTLSGDLIAFQ